MRFVFFGAPGAGKGTMAAEASKEFGLPHISSGELFRAAIRECSPLGLQVKELIGRGSLVPDDLTIKIVHERLASPDAANGWLLDGFPRTIPQARSLSEIDPEDYVIDLEVSDEKVIERLSGRRMCGKCGRSYHVTLKPPKVANICDYCGVPLYIREDDNVESIRRRIETYRVQTAPLVDFYRSRATLVPIDGEGDATSVWHELRILMARLMGLQLVD
ncbi:MAG: adenylate kinase [Spirochaetales bacterium]|nr:MAG: adenylate kinase [Spirochaetales bacterium]